MINNFAGLIYCSITVAVLKMWGICGLIALSSWIISKFPISVSSVSMKLWCNSSMYIYYYCKLFLVSLGYCDCVPSYNLALLVLWYQKLVTFYFSINTATYIYIYIYDRMCLRLTWKIKLIFCTYAVGFNLDGISN